MEAFFTKNKTAILAVAGVATSAAFLVWLHQRTQTQKSVVDDTIPPPPPPKEEKRESNSNTLSYEVSWERIDIPLDNVRNMEDISLPKDLIEKLIKNVEVTDGKFSFFGLSTLSTAVKGISFPKYYMFRNRIREERRRQGGYDEERYIASMTECVEGLRKLLKENLLHVLKELNVSEEVYMTSLRETGEPDAKVEDHSWSLSGILDQIRDGYPDVFFGKDIDDEKYVKVVKELAELYKKEVETLKALKEKHPNLSKQDAIKVIEDKIYDEIYRKYQVDEEAISSKDKGKSGPDFTLVYTFEGTKEKIDAKEAFANAI